MGTDEKLVPGELLVVLPELKIRVKQIFKMNSQMNIYKNIFLNKNMNEEI